MCFIHTNRYVMWGSQMDDDVQKYLPDVDGATTVRNKKIK